MRIVSISTSDIGHGAGIAAYRLHTALLRSGHDAIMLVSEKLTSDPSVINLLDTTNFLSAHIINPVARLFERGSNISGLQNLYSVVGKKLMGSDYIRNADIIHIHNLHWHSRNFSMQLLPYLSRMKPVVWTIHDMWPMTGHCLYAYDCLRWQSGCGACPDLRRYMGVLFDTTAFLVKSKRKVLDSSSVALKHCLQKSYVFREKEVFHIPNGIDTNIFTPALRKDARNKLGLPTDAWVTLFASSDLNGPRKGGKYFIDALKQLSRTFTPHIVLCVGKGEIPEQERAEGIEFKSLGYVVSEKQMADIYAASDVYVMPSLQDNLPNVVLEAMACGTPVVCFDTGGLPEMVVHGENGWLARLRDSVDLATGVEHVRNSLLQSNLMRESAVKRVESAYSLEKMASSYLNLYNSLVQKFSCNQNDGR